ncbi:hypothetical protein ABTO05_20845, partial [Acinetobacter baumannii]
FENNLVNVKIFAAHLRSSHGQGWGFAGRKWFLTCQWQKVVKTGFNRQKLAITGINKKHFMTLSESFLVVLNSLSTFYSG